MCTIDRLRHSISTTHPLQRPELFGRLPVRLCINPRFELRLCSIGPLPDLLLLARRAATNSLTAEVLVMSICWWDDCDESGKSLTSWPPSFPFPQSLGLSLLETLHLNLITVFRASIVFDKPLARHRSYFMALLKQCNI